MWARVLQGPRFLNGCMLFSLLTGPFSAYGRSAPIPAQLVFLARVRVPQVVRRCSPAGASPHRCPF